MKRPSLIIKSDGKPVPFQPDKVRQSLLRAGARPVDADRVLEELHQHIYPGISTKALYRIAYRLLRGLSKPVAARYRLKQALLDLGPSGFPFEKYVAELFNHADCITRVNQVMDGLCVRHEVDVEGTRAGVQFFMECKYHNSQGNICDVKVPLYVKARVEDLAGKWLETHAAGKWEGWLVTNTRFSSDALQFGQCAGLHMLSWDFPAGKGLKDMIDQGGLYPVTCLSGLTKHEKLALLESGVVLCETLLKDTELIRLPGMTEARKTLLLEELDALCNGIKRIERI